MSFLSRFSHQPVTDPNAGSERQKFYREWEHQRSQAISRSDLAEIDAIFSRYDRNWS